MKYLYDNLNVVTCTYFIEQGTLAVVTGCSYCTVLRVSGRLMQTCRSPATSK